MNEEEQFIHDVYYYFFREMKRLHAGPLAGLGSIAFYDPIDIDSYNVTFRYSARGDETIWGVIECPEFSANHHHTGRLDDAEWTWGHQPSQTDMVKLRLIISA